jgi:hypothetical protein
MLRITICETASGQTIQLEGKVVDRGPKNSAEYGTIWNFRVAAENCSPTRAMSLSLTPAEDGYCVRFISRRTPAFWPIRP